MIKNTVLIIDDSPVDRMLMKKILENNNPEVIAIENETGRGYEEQIINHDVKCIILDLLIESVDGVDILRRLKKDAVLKEIPVIVCSSVDSHQIIKETLTLGAYDYFEKPFSQRVMQYGFSVKVKNAVLMKRQSEDVEYLRTHDELTGLNTRKVFEEKLQNEMNKEKNPLSVIIVDINGLKVINDAYGHQIGDNILIEVSQFIQISDIDILSISRWGSDEIAILVPEGRKAKLEKIIETIRASIYDNKTYTYSVSFGWTINNNKYNQAKYLLQKAEDNLYSNKVLDAGSIRSKMIESIIHTLHQKNPREEMHSHRVSSISGKIASELGFSEYEVKKVKMAALMHDIGKITINEEILNKPGKLNKTEWEQIKKHPEYGFKILSTSADTLEIANTVLAHHERWDGKGYPKGLHSEEIPIMARIIAVADTYDAMTSARSYKASIKEDDAIKEIQDCSGSQFDPLVVEAFLSCVQVYEYSLE